MRDATTREVSTMRLRLFGPARCSRRVEHHPRNRLAPNDTRPANRTYYDAQHPTSQHTPPGVSPSRDPKCGGVHPRRGGAWKLVSGKTCTDFFFGKKKNLQAAAVFRDGASHPRAGALLRRTLRYVSASCASSAVLSRFQGRRDAHGRIGTRAPGTASQSRRDASLVLALLLFRGTSRAVIGCRRCSVRFRLPQG